MPKLPGVKIGELLRLPAHGYDTLNTIDQRIAEGHEIPASIAVIPLAVRLTEP